MRRNQFSDRDSVLIDSKIPDTTLHGFRLRNLTIFFIFLVIVGVFLFFHFSHAKIENMKVLNEIVVKEFQLCEGKNIYDTFVINGAKYLTTNIDERGKFSYEQTINGKDKGGYFFVVFFLRRVFCFYGPLSFFGVLVFFQMYVLICFSFCSVAQKSKCC
jgi:hypothetical protein